MLGHLSGKVAGLSADVAELESAIGQRAQETREQLAGLSAASRPAPAPPSPNTAPVPAKVILRIWVRALVATALFWVFVVALFTIVTGGAK